MADPQDRNGGFGSYALGASGFDASSVGGWRKALRNNDGSGNFCSFPLPGNGVRTLDVEVSPENASPLAPPSSLHIYTPDPDTGMPRVSSFPMARGGATRLQLQAGDPMGRENDTGVLFACTEPANVKVLDTAAAPGMKMTDVPAPEPVLPANWASSAPAEAFPDANFGLHGEGGIDLSLPSPLLAGDRLTRQHAHGPDNTDPALQKGVAYKEPSGMNNASALQIGGNGDGIGLSLRNEDVKTSLQVNQHNLAVTAEQSGHTAGVEWNMTEKMSPTGAMSKIGAEAKIPIFDGKANLGVKPTKDFESREGRIEADVEIPLPIPFRN